MNSIRLRTKRALYVSGSEASFVSIWAGRSRPKALQELGPLNRLLERGEAFSQISRHRHSDGYGLELRMMRRWRSPEVSTAADRRSFGEVRLSRKTSPRQSVRGTELHAECSSTIAGGGRENGAAWRSAVTGPNRSRTATASRKSTDKLTNSGAGTTNRSLKTWPHFP